MKRAVLALILVIMFVLWLAYPAIASGDKVRGDKGQGCINQIQEQDPLPFQP